MHHFEVIINRGFAALDNQMQRILGVTLMEQSMLLVDLQPGERGALSFSQRKLLAVLLSKSISLFRLMLAYSRQWKRQKGLTKTN